MSAPSFSSFPPSFSSFPDFEADSIVCTSAQSTATKSSLDKDKREKKSKDKSKGRKRSRHRHKDDHDQDHVDGRKTSTPSITNNETSRIYYSDKKGDTYNIQYGGLHAGDIPKYHIVDMTHRGGKGVEVGPRGRRKMRNLTDSTARALLLARPTCSLIPSGDTYKHHEVDGFLRLPSRRSRAINVGSYRSITVSRDDASSDSDTSDASEHASSDESSSDEITLTSHQEKTKLIEKELGEEPTSVGKWLQLLSHALSEIPQSSKNATRARSEVTVSILERAFSVDTRNKMSTILRVRYLKAGEEVWQQGQVKEEWEKALTLGEMDIWMEWLEWRTREAVNGIDGAIEDAIRILSMLGKQDELSKVRVFWRIAVLLQRAGFVERATAMFQAQAELAFNVPKRYQSLSHEAQIEHLEAFWESEAPRVGEAESRGWSVWASNNEGQVMPLNKSDTAPQAELDPYRQWASFELRMDEGHFMPSRSYDDIDDPYSAILFSDIRPLLICLTLPAAKDAFRRAWLSFAGLHIPGFSLAQTTSNETDWDDRWNLGYLTRAAYLDALLPPNVTQARLTNESFAGVIVGREQQYADACGPVKSWGHGVLGPLDAVRVSDKGKAKAAMWTSKDVEGVNHSFVRNLFSQLRLGADDADWDVLGLAFEAAINGKAATRLSRTMLSQNETLTHWLAHAQLEQIRERNDDARKIYQTVLTGSRVRGTSSLWWNWAHMEWLDGNVQHALQVVLRSVGVEGQGGVTVLRCKRGLDDAIKEERDWKSREGWIKLRALVEILTGHDAIMGAIQVFDDHLFGERKRGPRRENLLVACLLTIYQYGVLLKNPMPPAVLRQRVEKAMEEYPTNSIILGLFLEGERGQGVWGRVRGILGEREGKMKDVMRRVEEVWIGGWAQRSGEVERARNSLAVAVETERTRGSYVLWRIYIELEIRTGRLVQAKKLLFRAIGECPLVKELYLLAFGPLRSVFSGRELGGIGDTMTERGLRLRRGLDDALVGWKEGVEGVELSESGDETIFEEAGELRRLMPY
ncbi:hypothetical protein H0H92_003530 [Tricholoma furcatifolium]|nr:hypothetical protein H0H92_003530 [Tricholoma furcatifolium]